MPKGKGYGSPAEKAGVNPPSMPYTKGKGRKLAGRGGKGLSNYSDRDDSKHATKH